MKSYDLLATARSIGDYYFCTDTMKLYKDTSTGRHELNAVIVGSEIERLTSIRPANGKYYYIYETNELWLYNAGWTVIVGTVRTSNGYYYANNKINATSDVSEVLDNNGLLGDGAVVVRDANRIIKGKLYIDPESNNLVITSFLGGGFTFLPSGTLDENGALRIDSVITYEGIDQDDPEYGLIETITKGRLRFCGSMYERDPELDTNSKVITIQDLYDLHIISSTTGDVYIGSSAPSSASYNIWIDNTDVSHVVYKKFDGTQWVEA